MAYPNNLELQYTSEKPTVDSGMFGVDHVDVPRMGTPEFENSQRGQLPQFES